MAMPRSFRDSSQRLILKNWLHSTNKMNSTIIVVSKTLCTQLDTGERVTKD